MLERSLNKTPISDPATGKPRYLKLPPASVCNKVLDSAAHVKDAEFIHRAADLATALQYQGITLEPRTVQSITQSLTATANIIKAIELLDSWLSANQEAIQEEAEKEEEELEELANAESDGAYQVITSLLEAAAKADDPDAINQILLRMVKVGYSPSAHTMTALLQCFTRLGHLNTAHSMLQWMRRSNKDISAYHYAALMTLPNNLSSPSAAKAFLAKSKEAYEDMKQHDVSPSAPFYAAYINVGGRLGDLEAAQDLLNRSTKKV